MERNKRGQFIKGHQVLEETKKKAVITRRKNNSYKSNKGSFKKGDKFWQGKKRENISLENNYNWKGGKIIQNKYVYVLCPSHPKAKSKKGYVAEHVLVMEKKIGRHLKGKEEVHHIDRDRLNNSFSNLKLFKSRSEHIRFHRRKIEQNEDKLKIEIPRS